MKRGINTALLPILSLIIAVAAITLSVSGNTITAVNAASPAQLNDWTTPQNISLSSNYDNTSSIGAASNGAVTIGWEQRNDPTATRNYIRQASNTSLGGPFNNELLASSSYKSSGNVKVRGDSQGRRHVIWWEQIGTNVTDHYAIIGADGNSILNEAVPNTNNLGAKGTAMAVGPDDTVHMLFGRNNNDISYWARTAAGVWTVQGESIPVPNATSPTHLTLGVTSNGVVMAGWVGTGPGGYYDVYTAVRTAPNDWLVEDVSYVCCTGCPGNSRTYNPQLQADPTGGMRLSWNDETCDPRSDPRSTDMYYREWVPGTGWDGKPLVRIEANDGEAYTNAIAVDQSGLAHIMYSDDTGSGFHNYQMFYITGKGTSFSAPEVPYRTWGAGSFQKEPSIDHSPGWLHVTFNSNRTDSRKDVLYSREQIQEAVPSPTATPVVSPPRCPNERFTDVCPGDYFYTATLNLVDAGVISGYNTVPPCDAPSHISCFRPQISITRGQAAKVIALGATLPSNLQGAPHFTDVPGDHIFYNWVEFAYNAGVVSGYPCGGANEPCDSANRSYFRPGATITRGQLSKMVSQAFGYGEPVTGQTFEDVPSSNPFYLFIERIARRGIIGGYNCGLPEPCVPPANRPYFRPNSEVIRGQTTKIVDGARSYVPPTSPPSDTATSTPTTIAVITETPTITPTPTATSQVRR
jgi:hypothetical protein